MENNELIMEMLAEIKGLSKQVGGLAEQVGGLSQRMDKMEHRMDSIEHRMDSMQSDITGIKGELTEFRASVDANFKKTHEKIDSRFKDTVEVVYQVSEKVGTFSGDLLGAIDASKQNSYDIAKIKNKVG